MSEIYLIINDTEKITLVGRKSVSRYELSQSRIPDIYKLERRMTRLRLSHAVLEHWEKHDLVNKVAVFEESEETINDIVIFEARAIFYNRTK